MTHPLLRESGPGKMRADAIAIFALGVLGAIAVVSLTVQQFIKTFTPEGIVWRLPVQQQQSTAAGLVADTTDGNIDPEQVSGTLTHLLVTVPNLNTVSAVCLGAAIILAALGLLVIIAGTVRTAWLFQQGRFFTLATSRAVRTITWGLVGGGLGTFACWHLAQNGVEAALNVGTTSGAAAQWWSVYVLMLFAVTAFGLIDIALRRAIRVQHDTEGLV